MGARSQGYALWIHWEKRGGNVEKLTKLLRALSELVAALADLIREFKA